MFPDSITKQKKAIPLSKVAMVDPKTLEFFTFISSGAELEQLIWGAKSIIFFSANKPQKYVEEELQTSNQCF